VGVIVVRKLPYVILCVALVLLLGLIVPFSASAIIGIPQTGQDKCYGQTPTGQDEIPCPGNGRDGEQRSGVPWSHPCFFLTYCCSTGVCADKSADRNVSALTNEVMENFTGSC
jgi:hypothetical protein